MSKQAQPITSPHRLTLTFTERVALKMVLEYLESEIEDMEENGKSAGHIGHQVEVLRLALERKTG